MTKSVNIAEAKAHLWALVDRAAAGEEIILSRAGRLIARLVPLPNAVHGQPASAVDGRFQTSCPSSRQMRRTCGPPKGQARMHSGGADPGGDAPAARHACFDLVAHGQPPTFSCRTRGDRRSGQSRHGKCCERVRIANNQRLGRLPGRIAQDLPKALREARIPVHALTLAHTIAAGLLPGPHRDP
jgi:prevent-host-death family protein